MNLRDEIWDWTGTLDHWQNDLLRRIYEEGELDERGREQVLKNLLATLKGEELPFKPIRLSKDQIQTSISDNESVKVLSLSNLENVGTVTEKGRLDFLADGLTVIYGENGAGKSSYARVLKKACRAIKQDLNIHPNAFEKSNGEGTAKIKIQKEGGEEIIKRRVNDKPNPILNSISIYDRDCAEAYTEGKVMDIPYLPSDLRSMKQMVNEQNSIREYIQNDVNRLKEEIESLEVELDEFPQDNEIYPIVNSLSPDTDLEKLSELKGLNDQETEQLEKLEEKLSASDPKKRQKKISNLESKKSGTESIVDRLNKIDKRINKRLEKVFPNLINEIQTLKSSQKMLKEEFENTLPGTGNEAWKTLWKAARNFSATHAYEDEEFPVLEKDGQPAKCVLCQQPLKETGIEERYKQFDKFIEHDIEKKLNKKRKERDAYVKKIENLKLSDVLSELARNTLEENDKELTEKLDEIANILSSRKDKIVKLLQDEKWEGKITPITVAVKESLNSLVREYQKQIKSFNDLKRQNEKDKLRKKINELRAKKELDKKFDAIKIITKNKQMIAFLQKAREKLNSKPISDKVRKLGTDIADEIEDELKEYLSTFRAGYLPFEVKGKARAGATKSEMTLETEQQLSIKDVLSEGEQNVVSLAYFLSEISHADHNGTLIFDDPVSSLDDTRRDYVASILANLSKERQVIVFTHDIYFMTKLERNVNSLNSKIDYLWIWGDENVSGYTKNELPFRRKTPQKMLDWPKGKLQHLKNAGFRLDPDQKREIVSQFYKYLRMTWEAAIEKVFLASVIQRYDYRVKVGGVARLNLTEEMKEDVDEGWTNSSEFLHFEGDLSSKPLPTINQMEKDYNALEQFINKYKED